MGWITENICNFATDILNAVISIYGNFIGNVFFRFVDIANTNIYYQNAQRFFVALGFALAALMAVKIVASGYLLETAYDSEEDPFNLLIRVAETVAVISCSGWIFEYGLRISRDFCDDLIGSTNVSGYGEQTLTLLQEMQVINESFISALILLVIICISFIIFTIMSGIRAGELLVMTLFVPIFAIDLMTNSRERWNNFFTGYVFAFISYAIQTFFFMLALKSYVLASYMNQDYMLSALIWIIVAIKAPQSIEKYLYQTGVSRAASSGIRMVIQTAALKLAR